MWCGGPGCSRRSWKREGIMARTLQTVSQPGLSSSRTPGMVETGPMQRRILIAEDNELTRQQLKQLLEADPKVQVDTTGNGIEALEALIEHNYSVVITDLKMP